MSPRWERENTRDGGGSEQASRTPTAAAAIAAAARGEVERAARLKPLPGTGPFSTLLRLLRQE